jgi:hypothetical protein
MATIAPTKAKRDENLDKLKSAVQEWGDKEKTRLEEETSYLRSVLEGRGASDTGTKNISAASELLAQAVTDFIIYGEKE